MVVADDVRVWRSCRRFSGVIGPDDGEFVDVEMDHLVEGVLQGFMPGDGHHVKGGHIPGHHYLGEAFLEQDGSQIVDGQDADEFPKASTTGK